MEHLITISLAEYNEIKDIKNNFIKAFNEKKTIVFHDSYFSGPSGYPKHKFTVVNNDEFANDLLNKINGLEKENNDLWSENCKLKEQINKKKSWFK